MTAGRLRALAMLAFSLTCGWAGSAAAAGLPDGLGARRAVHASLPPGGHRLKPSAASADCAPRRDGAAPGAPLPPRVLHAVWPKLLAAVVVMAVAWALHSLRLRRVSAALEARFQVRAAERERIARELHDSLLQGFQGLMLRFQAISNRLPPDDPVRQDIDRALDRADGVLVEGRSRVRDLRNQGAQGGLADALIDLAREHHQDGGPAIDLAVEGAARPMPPLVSEELLRIAKEAVGNAITHAQATRIAIRLAFGRRRLTLSIADDGLGLPAPMREAGGYAGHGLAGMREGAERIGGRLTLATRQDGGTEIVVRMSAHVAYADAPRAWRLRGGLAPGDGGPT